MVQGKEDIRRERTGTQQKPKGKGGGGEISGCLLAKARVQTGEKPRWGGCVKSGIRARDHVSWDTKKGKKLEKMDGGVRCTAIQGKKKREGQRLARPLSKIMGVLGLGSSCTTQEDLGNIHIRGSWKKEKPACQNAISIRRKER